MTVTRTQDIVLTPAELADLFCAMTGHDQAAFLEQVHRISSTWPGAGWEYQAECIAENLSPGGHEIVVALSHFASRHGDRK